MDEDKRAARRKLLSEIKGPWDSEKLGVAMDAAPQPPTPEVQAAVEAAAARVVAAHDDAPISVPTMDQLDADWGDEGDASDDDVSEPELPDDDDASEPELPDERLDPAAYAAAKLAREERMEARRERRRAKVEAKKARRRARADAAKGKQKGKTRKARPTAPATSPAAKATAAVSKRVEAEEILQAPAALSPVSAKAAKARTSKPRTTTNTWMLAVALGVLVAAAIAAAVVFR